MGTIIIQTMKASQRRRQEKLLRETISTMLHTMSNGPSVPQSRMRRLTFVMKESSGLLPPQRLVLSEDYIVNVLGFSRRSLNESSRDPEFQRMVIREHLLFEGWWSNVKDKIIDTIKDNPITSAAEAVKEAGSGLKGVVVALTGIVSTGGDAIGTVVSGAQSLMSKGLQAVKKALGKIAARIKELAGKVTIDKIKSLLEKFANGMSGLVEKIVGGVQKATSAGGWKGMMASIAAFLAVVAIRGKIENFSGTALDILSGDPKKMVQGAMKMKSMVDSVIGGDEEGEGEEGKLDIEKEIEDAKKAGASADEAKEQGAYVQAVQLIMGAIKGFAWGLLKKVLGSAGVAAIEQIAGPVAWIKKLAEMFEKVAGGVGWVAENIMSAISRASFRIGGSSSGST